jgi:hypothetical protein
MALFPSIGSCIVARVRSFGPVLLFAGCQYLWVWMTKVGTHCRVLSSFGFRPTALEYILFGLRHNLWV